MHVFNPSEGNKMIRLIDAYDAIREFVKLNYGDMLETTDGFADIFVDTDRSVMPGGFPPDESTWDAWVEACALVTSRLKD